MQMLFKQKMFSWLDSYDIFDQEQNTLFTVKGRFSWGHKLEIYDCDDNFVGAVVEKIMHFMPHFALYMGTESIGELRKEFSFFRPIFTLNCGDLVVEGNMFEWDYSVTDSQGNLIMTASKEIFSWTDTYVIDVPDPKHMLISLMIVLAIDAAKCSEN